MSQEIANLNQENVINREIIDSVYSTYQNQSQSELSNTLSQLESIGTSNNIVSNQSVVNRVYSSVMFDNSISDIDKFILEDIAFQCPLIGGQAVYQARGILSQLGYSESYNDSDLCYSNSYSNTRKRTESARIGLFPNPTTGQFTLSIRSLINENYELTLSNMMGQVVKKVSSIPSNQETTLDVSSLENGVYIYSLSNGHEITQGQLVVSK